MLTSVTNPTVRRIRALQHRKWRDETGTYFVEGIRLVGTAVEAVAPIEVCVYAPDLLRSNFGKSLVETMRGNDVPCHEVTARVFTSLSGKEHPQGIGLVAQQQWIDLASVQPGNELCWVALEATQDPGNVGTVLRTCDAVGAGGAIFLGDTTDPYDPTSVRASMGAIFSRKVIRAKHADLAMWKRRFQCTVVGASDGAATIYNEMQYQYPLTLLLGSEREGLSVPSRELCDAMIRIPMVGSMDSLNLAVAGGVILYEVFNQSRRSK